MAPSSGRMNSDSPLMLMPVVQVGVMRVAVGERRVAVPMGMRLAGRIIGPVFMLMMFVMDMAMGMLHRFMRMFVVVGFHEMQIKPEAHQHSGNAKAGAERIAQQRHRQQRSGKRRRREIGAGAGSAEIAQTQDEQHQTDAIAEKADQRRRSEPGRCGLMRAHCQRQRKIDVACDQAFHHRDL